jgi:hypothetical protein
MSVARSGPCCRGSSRTRRSMQKAPGAPTESDLHGERQAMPLACYLAVSGAATVMP